jgi:endonuclease-3
MPRPTVSSRKPAKPPRRAAAKTAPATQRLPRLLAALKKLYPNSGCSLKHDGPYQLLVATILSAQCTDQRVNQVTPALFARYPTAGGLAAARPEELEGLIQSTGFYRNKAKSLLGMATALVERHGGKVPAEMEDLVQLPGVGRKTANVVLGNAFGQNEGIVVDTHVARLSQRLGLTRHSDPVKIEQDLMALVPREDWTLWAHLLIDHGRKVCQARRPRCGECALAGDCPSADVARAKTT